MRFLLSSVGRLVPLGGLETVAVPVGRQQGGMVHDAVDDGRVQDAESGAGIDGATVIIGAARLEGFAEQWPKRVDRAAARRTQFLSEASRPSTSTATQIHHRHSVVRCAVMNRRMFFASLVMPVLAGCSARAPVRSTPDRYVRRGLASWYGDAFDGKPTASGEPFDSNQFTTAHYDLPFDSRVRVRNLNNDREVELRVNDRVPLEALNNGRILDVSYAAARQLEMVEDGVVPHRDHRLGVGPLPVNRVARRRAGNPLVSGNTPDGLDGGPQELTVCEDRCDPLGLQPHRVAAIWRELVHRVQVALTHKDETPACHAGEAHSSESDLGVAAGVVRRDDLIGGQRHSEPARE